MVAIKYFYSRRAIFFCAALMCVFEGGSSAHRPGPQNFGNRRPFGSLAQLNAIRRNSTLAEYADNIEFKFFHTNGTVARFVSINDDDDFKASECASDQKYSIIVHGWTESCNHEWMPDLVRNLIKYRGGCIICMDYNRYSSQDYGRLVRSFEPIAQILTAKLFQMEWRGFDPNNGFMFGFSFGGQLVSEAGRRFGENKLKAIDICDMAGPGFDYRVAQPNHKLAAQNVQCIHTSLDKGTRFSSCHQNWKMGNCGITQPAAGPPPKGHHGLCPYFYNSAFEHNFYAIPKPRECATRRPAATWPKGFKMGYNEDRKSSVEGELFAITTAAYPFTLDNSNRYLDNDNTTNHSEYETTTLFVAESMEETTPITSSDVDDVSDNSNNEDDSANEIAL